MKRHLKAARRLAANLSMGTLGDAKYIPVPDIASSRLSPEEKLLHRDMKKLNDQLDEALYRGSGPTEVTSAFYGSGVEPYALEVIEGKLREGIFPPGNVFNADFSAWPAAHPLAKDAAQLDKVIEFIDTTVYAHGESISPPALKRLYAAEGVKSPNLTLKQLMERGRLSQKDGREF